jgi:hypothetical protein
VVVVALASSASRVAAARQPTFLSDDPASPKPAQPTILTDDPASRTRARRFLLDGDFGSARKEIYALLRSERATEKAAAAELLFVLDSWSPLGGRPNAAPSELSTVAGATWQDSFALARSILVDGDYDEAVRRLDSLTATAPDSNAAAAASELHFLALEAKRDRTPEPPPELADEPEHVTSTAVEEDFPRFRCGFSGLGGPFVTRGETGGVAGVDARIGLQANSVFAFYAQPFALLGRSQGTGLLGAGGVGVLVDATFGDLVYVAVGPEVFVVADASRFSFASRLGFALGSSSPDRRTAFTVGLDLRLVALDRDAAVFPLIALGYEAF